VCNFPIQNISLSFLDLSSHLKLFSIILMIFYKAPAFLLLDERRCRMRGKSGLHLMSLLWLFLRLLYDCTVSPPYWSPQVNCVVGFAVGHSKRWYILPQWSCGGPSMLFPYFSYKTIREHWPVIQKHQKLCKIFPEPTV